MSLYSNYMRKIIIEKVANINDEQTLNLIYTIIMNAIPAENSQEDS